MKIEKIVIDGFGKLKNTEYTFSDGINLIYGKNESGKSTICEFILSMLYGLPNKGKQTHDDLAAREMFKPWDTESFGGSLYFTDDNGKHFVIERSFKATKRGDKAVLRDGDTWEELADADNIGEKLFGISREAFLKTLYVKSFGADSLKSDDGEIMSRLSNLETSGDEDVSYSEIVNNLEKEIYSLKTKTGRGGKITATEDKIAALTRELSMSEMTFKGIKEKQETAEQLKLSAQELEKEAAIIEEKYKTALSHEKFLKVKEAKDAKNILKEKYEKELKKSEELKEQLNNTENDSATGVSAETVNRARALETKRLMAQEKVNEAKAKLLPEEETKILGDNRIIPGFFGLILLLVGFFIKSNILWIAGLLVAIFGILICVVINSNKKKENDKNKKDYEIAEEELSKIDDELTEIFSPFGVTVSDELSALFVTSADKEERKKQLKAQYEESQNEIESLKKSLSVETEEESFSKEEIEYDGESSQKLYEKINSLKSESKNLTYRANEIMLSVAKDTAEIRTEDEIKAETELLEEEREVLLKKHSALTKAYEWLALARDEIKKNFAPRLNEKASHILSCLTNDKYAQMRTDDKFGINIETQTTGIKQAEYMSRGTYDLIYIALRFAAMSVLTDGKIPFLILDDAFSQLDDERLQKSAEFLKESKEFSQVFLFTCHENYKEILKDTSVTELQ